MSSFRQHRIIIASLFLPNTAVFGESTPSTPDHHASPPVAANAATPASFRLAPPSAGRVTPAPAAGQVKSIVDDLIMSKHGSYAASPKVLTPGIERANPFSKQLTQVNLAEAATKIIKEQEQVASPVSTTTNGQGNGPDPTSRRKYLRADLGQTRVQRKRSFSRRSDDSLRSGCGSFSARASSKFLQLWHIEPNTHCNGGLKNAVDSVGDKLRRKLWVGTLGTMTDGVSEDTRRAIDRRMRDQCESLPVWIPDEEFEKCYDEFCHQVLWPCLHYAVPDAPKTKLFYESASFKQYVAVNQRFADTIAEHYQDGDIVWVNDYHLMLLPLLLRKSLHAQHKSSSPIGFFMHVAFPSSEIFRCLSVRETLLRGLLAADLVGFQTADYARHFRQTVSRILSLEALPKGIQVEGAGGGEGARFVDVGVFAMGIDVAALKEKKREPEVREWVQTLKQRYAGMKIIVGRDKLDEVQGVSHKIQAFEYFLEKYPEFQEKVVLIQVGLQTTEKNSKHTVVADFVSHINSRFSTLTYQPVVFLHTQDLTFSQYLALLSVADAFLVTSLREGMALRTHEFVVCQEERHRPLILSEFTGSYSYHGFQSCFAINPWDTKGTAKAIQKALTIGDEEALTHWQDLHNHVTSQTAQKFVTLFLTRLMRAHTEHHQSDLSLVPRFDASRLLPRYRHSRRRLLLVDFEGTAWLRDMSREGLLKPFEPPEDAMALFERLVGDRRNEVWALSGLPVKDVLEKVAERVPGLGIVAENGCFIRTIPTRNSPAAWINMVANFNLTWKTTCLEILHYFTERTPGSFVEEREASIVWRFWTGPTHDECQCQDRQWARRQGAEAQNHIFDSLGERYGLRIIPGMNSFLVLPNNVSRSTAVGAILQPGGPMPTAGGSVGTGMPDEGVNRETDFVLAMGKDETLLRRLNELEDAETCSTNKKGTNAKWQCDPGNARSALWQFTSVVSS